MKKKIVNLFLAVAVPVISFGKFYCTDISGDDIAVIGTRTGLPAIWDRKYILKYWWDVKYLIQSEKCTEEMCYKDFSKGILADDEFDVKELLSFAAHNDDDLCMNDLIS